MIVVSILLSIAAIGVICCLLFYLAVYALPLFAGVTAGVWASGTGAGWLGGIAVGVIAGLATLLVGHLLLAFIKPLWLRLMVAAAFVAPAAIAGYHATHGIVKHTLPSETWQIAFSLVGAVVVGITAFVRVATLAPPGNTGQAVARARRHLQQGGFDKIALLRPISSSIGCPMLGLAITVSHALRHDPPQNAKPGGKRERTMPRRLLAGRLSRHRPREGCGVLSSACG